MSWAARFQANTLKIMTVPLLLGNVLNLMMWAGAKLDMVEIETLFALKKAKERRPSVIRGLRRAVSDFRDVTNEVVDYTIASAQLSRQNLLAWAKAFGALAAFAAVGAATASGSPFVAVMFARMAAVRLKPPGGSKSPGCAIDAWSAASKVIRTWRSDSSS